VSQLAPLSAGRCRREPSKQSRSHAQPAGMIDGLKPDPARREAQLQSQQARWSGISLSRGDEMRRRATERAPSSRHAHPENSMNDGLWPVACAVFNSRRLHPKSCCFEIRGNGSGNFSVARPKPSQSPDAAAKGAHEARHRTLRKTTSPLTLPPKRHHPRRRSTRGTSARTRFRRSSGPS